MPQDRKSSKSRSGGGGSKTSGKGPKTSGGSRPSGGGSSNRSSSRAGSSNRGNTGYGSPRRKGAPGKPQEKGQVDDSNAKVASPKPKKKAKQTPRTPFQHIQEIVKWVDLVIEVLDARVPLSTRHPEAEKIFGHRPRLLVLTKEDLADPAECKKFRAQLEAETKWPCQLLSLKLSSGKQRLLDAAVAATRERQEALVRKGLLPRPMRVCVVGLPNVGKSSLINWLIGSKHAKTGDRPGITKGTQWVRVHPELELLDTPGILPPIAFGAGVRDKLAVVNLVPPHTYNPVDIAEHAFVLLQEKYPQLLDDYVEKLSQSSNGMESIAIARNLLSSGAKPDTQRAAIHFLSDVRDGKLGRFTLDS